MSATPDSSLGDSSRTIADLRRELAECKADRDAALARESATAEVLQVINSSPGDLQPVFDAILEKAHTICGVDRGVLQLYDGEYFRAVATHGVPEAVAATVREPNRPAPGELRAQLLAGARFAQAADLAESEAYRAGVPSVRAVVDIAGTRSVLWVPLRKDGVLLGAISAARTEVRPFSNKEIALLENFAAQAVIAIENARLLTETREALDQQTATAEVLRVINSSPGNLAPVFDAMLEKATRLCEAPFGVLRSWDGECFHVCAVHGEPRFSDWVRQRGPTRPEGDDPLARITKGAGVVHFAHPSDDPAYGTSPVFRRAVEISGMRSGLTVPMRKDEALLGAITIYRQEVRPFTEKQIALLQNFAAQAVIATENVRLITETREALEQQTATAEVLQVINSSPGDLAPVFDAMLEKALSLCEASFGIMNTYDGERLFRVAERGLTPAFNEWRETNPVGSSSAGIPLSFQRLIAGERVVHIADLRTEEAYQIENPNARALVDLAGARTQLCVALPRGHTVCGMFTIFRQEVRPFAEKQIALLENFAAQAVIAMENARLLIETREGLEQQTATAEVLQVINSSPGNLTPVFDAILEKAHTLCGADHGTLTVADGEYFRAIAMRGISEGFAEVLRRPFVPTHEFHEQLLGGERFIHIADLTEAQVSSESPFHRAAVDLGGVRTVLVVPLRRDDAILGAITAFRQEVRPFSDQQIALLQNFAAQAVIAMENARLVNETREALEQQTATAEVLQVINASPGDLTPVFDAILEKAHSLCGIATGSLALFDGEYFRAVAVRGVPESLADRLREGYRGSDNPISQPLLDRARFVHIPDLDEIDHPAVIVAAEPTRTRTLLCVPLRKGEKLFGMITAGRLEVQPFSDKQIALLHNFAAQAVIAMENARLLTETREALEQQTATAEVLQVINSSPGDLAPVFDAMLEKATLLCEAPFGILRTWDGEQFQFGAVHGEPWFANLVRQRHPFRQSHDGSPLGRILAGEPIVHVANTLNDEGYQTSSSFRDMVEASGVRSGIMVALRKEDALLGTITVYRSEVRPFSDKQIALLQNFAAQAVIAIENARLLGELRQRTDEVAELNRGLEVRVAEQVDELGRIGRLKRFLAPQLAELIVSQGDEKILESHRREIVVVFCDLRGYTAFTETAEPEEVLDFLREYHGALGPLVAEYEGTLDQFSGDGIMVFFNDPVPCPDPAERAVKMAMAMREEAGKLIATWRRDGCELGFGAGIAQGYATLGQIGFSERSGYTAIGTVCNLAARLCAEAKDGQILISSRVARAVEAVAILEDLGNLELRGLRRPVAAFNVVQSTSAADARPNLTVVARGPGA